MECILHAQARLKSTKSFLKESRKHGKVPGVCYGQKDNYNILFELKDFEYLFHHALYHRIIKLNLQNTKLDVFIKEYQIHPVTKKIIHVDFLEVSYDKPLLTQVPVVLHGVPEGVKRGGVLEHKLTKLLIRSFPKHIPERIELNIEKLAVGDSIYVRDLVLEEDVEIRSKQDQVLVTVASSRVTRMTDEQEASLKATKTKA